MTNNVKPRLLSPSEIELWELAKAAMPEEPWFEADDLFKLYDETADFIRGSSPAEILSLLETLEKTRGALAARVKAIEAWRHVPDFSDHCSFCAVETAPHTTFRGTPCPIGVLCDLDDDETVRVLLSGFSGDASKEE